MIYQRKREKMIDHLKERGIKDDAVLKAMNTVPRHKFVAAGSEFHFLWRMVLGQ